MPHPAGIPPGPTAAGVKVVPPRPPTPARPGTARGRAGGLRGLHLDPGVGPDGPGGTGRAFRLRGADLNVVAELDGGHLQQDHPKVDEGPRPDMGLVAVVAAPGGRISVPSPTEPSSSRSRTSRAWASAGSLALNALVSMSTRRLSAANGGSSTTHRSPASIRSRWLRPSGVPGWLIAHGRTVPIGPTLANGQRQPSCLPATAQALTPTGLLQKWLLVGLIR
jgi:hypothetical protein